MDNLISIKDASKLLGVDSKTLRRWEEKGLIEPKRTKGGHRRYSSIDLTNLQGIENPEFFYCKVGSIEEKELVDGILMLINNYFKNK
jgi:predicted site-specific integrase-resolvase